MSTLHAPSKTLGADLRALRKARGLTLSHLAGILDRSVGWLSQVERDLSAPSASDLRLLADALNASVAMLAPMQAAASQETGFIVRSANRRPIAARQPGLAEELLSPDLTDDFEMIHSTFLPGSSSKGTVLRPTQEVGYLVSGKLELVIKDHAYTIAAGDSFRLRGEPFRWSNPYRTPAVAIWVIAPPVY